MKIWLEKVFQFIEEDAYLNPSRLEGSYELLGGSPVERRGQMGTSHVSLLLSPCLSLLSFPKPETSET